MSLFDNSRFRLTANFPDIDLWLQGVAVVLPQVQADLDPSRVEYVTLSLYVGLIIGATTWGSLADIIGRKLSWNITLLLSVSDSPIPSMSMIFLVS